MAQPTRRSSRPVAVFFYGSYINPAVLAEADLRPDAVENAYVTDWELRISPLANLVASPGSVAWGILTTATHAALEHLYTAHARDKLGGIYLPEGVVCRTDSGLRPALTYIAHDMEPAPPDPAYVERIAQPAERYGFPAPYVRHIRSWTDTR
jgi:hypothetical protein